MTIANHDTYEDYASLTGVRWSDLKLMAKSPLHYMAHIDGPSSDSSAMLFGRAVHCAILEPLSLPTSFTVYDGARRGKDWTEFHEVNSGKDILTRSEWDRVLGVQAAVMAHPVASHLLTGRGENEVTIQWTDPETGIACKGRLDRLITKPNPYIVDLKTTADLDPRRFVRTVSDFKYVSQLGFYRDGVGIARGIDCGAVIIAVEASDPFDVGVFRVTSDDLWSGSDEAHDLLTKLAACQESDDWPGRFPERQELELPPWTFASEPSDEIEVIAS